jgi:hypothetical protein
MLGNQFSTKWGQLEWMDGEEEKKRENADGPGGWAPGLGWDMPLMQMQMQMVTANSGGKYI